MDGDRRRLEASKQSNKSEKKEQKSQETKEGKCSGGKSKESVGRAAESVNITSFVGGYGKNERKANPFPQIRDILRKKRKPSKSEFASWTADNIIEKLNSYES